MILNRSLIRTRTRILGLIFLDDHGQYLYTQKTCHTIWLVVAIMGVLQRICFITTHDALLHDMYATPSLADKLNLLSRNKELKTW